MAGLTFPYYSDGSGIDFEPYDAFVSIDETTRILRLWTGNQELTGGDFLFFGQDGSGGMAAFWLAQEGKAVIEQPVVYLGSEGEVAVVASHLSDFLWLLADGLGPYEASVDEPDYQGAVSVAPMNDIAERHANLPSRSASQVIEEAKAKYSGFIPFIEGLCR